MSWQAVHPREMCDRWECSHACHRPAGNAGAGLCCAAGSVAWEKEEEKNHLNQNKENTHPGSSGLRRD